jgi:uncharacterized protein (DUF58 family)
MRSVFEDPTRIRGIREYQRGDAMNRIHWKSTARRGQLCSKLYDPVLEPGATVVLDFNRAAWSQATPTRPDVNPPEIAVEIACTISRYLSDGGWKLGFVSNGRDPLGLPGVTMAQARTTDSLSEALDAAREGRADSRLEPLVIHARKSREQFSVIHENLGRLELSDGLALEQALLSELPHIDREQVLVLITGYVPDTLISTLLRARQLDYRIMLFVVFNPRGHDRAFDELVGHGIEVYSMDEKWRLREIATGRRSF